MRPSLKKGLRCSWGQVLSAVIAAGVGLVLSLAQATAQSVLDRSVWIVRSGAVKPEEPVEFRLEDLPKSRGQGFPIGKLALLTQGAVHRSVIRLRELDVKTGQIRATFEKAALDAALKPGSLATLTFKSEAPGGAAGAGAAKGSEGEKKNRFSRRKQGER